MERLGAILNSLHLNVVGGDGGFVAWCAARIVDGIFMVSVENISSKRTG